MGTVVVPPPVFYFPSRSGRRAVHAEARRRRSPRSASTIPALTAFSPTNAAKSAELNQLGTDRITAIITGRDPLTALDQYIKDWKAAAATRSARRFQQDLKG